MGRVIKFRAWEPNNKEMVYFDNDKASKDIHMAQHLLKLIAGSHELGDNLLMQFTGLKDKHGIYIYEGDIVKSVSEILRPFDRSVKTRTGEYVTKYKAIEYREDQSSFCFVGCSITGISQNIATKYHEVVGNIYQNPELIKG